MRECETQPADDVAADGDESEGEGRRTTGLCVKRRRSVGL